MNRDERAENSTSSIKADSPREQDEHPFAPYVRTLGKGKKGSRSLTEEEAYQAMLMILDGQVLDLQLGAFLMLLRVKEESPEELAGFVRACKARIQAPQDLQVDLDWSSYAGKRRHLPWFLLAILILAQRGFRVFIHGASGHTHGRIYTEAALQTLGLPVAENWEMARAQLDRHNFCYMPLRFLNRRLDDMIQMRSVLGLRSPVHSLTRLLNPLNAPAVLQGIFHPPYSQLHQQAAQLLGYPSVTVIKGEGGEIERNPDATLTARSVLHGEIQEETWEPLSELRHVKPESLDLDSLKSVWAGLEEDSYGQRAVIGTLALAIKTMGKAQTQTEALALAGQWWEERNRDYFVS